MKIKHLDNGFYLLTPQQAAKLSVDGKLPGPGREKLAKIPDDLVLLQARRCTNALEWEEHPLDRDNLVGWIMQTKVVIHAGKIVNDWMWAIYFCRRGRYGETFIWNSR